MVQRCSRSCYLGARTPSDDADLMLPAGLSAAVSSPRESLIVLTRDGDLLGTLRNVVTGHVIVAVDAEHELAGLLIHDHGGVALIDTAAVSSSIAQLTQRLKSQFPDLVLVVAGSIRRTRLPSARRSPKARCTDFCTSRSPSNGYGCSWPLPGAATAKRQQTWSRFRRPGRLAYFRYADRASLCGQRCWQAPPW